MIQESVDDMQVDFRATEVGKPFKLILQSLVPPKLDKGHVKFVKHKPKTLNLQICCTIRGVSQRSRKAS